LLLKKLALRKQNLRPKITNSLSNDSQDKRITIARLGRPYGLKGWIFVQSFTDPENNIFNYTPCYLDTSTTPINIIEHKIHNKRWVMKAQGYNTPESVQALTNKTITTPRSTLPDSTPQDLYWCDLIGFLIQNSKHQAIGKVIDFIETGSNDVMIVKRLNGSETYVPYLNKLILNINTDNKILTMNWEE
jgi:16S rRNA processing protein RimM